MKTDCTPLYCLSQRFVRPLCFAATRLLIFYSTWRTNRAFAATLTRRALAIHPRLKIPTVAYEAFEAALITFIRARNVWRPKAANFAEERWRAALKVYIQARAPLLFPRRERDGARVQRNKSLDDGGAFHIFYGSRHESFFICNGSYSSRWYTRKARTREKTAFKMHRFCHGREGSRSIIDLSRFRNFIFWISFIFASS